MFAMYHVWYPSKYLKNVHCVSSIDTLHTMHSLGIANLPHGRSYGLQDLIVADKSWRLKYLLINEVP